MSTLRVATRGSALALAQARQLADAIERALGVRAELVPIKTSGDRLRGPLAALGGKGLFVKEIEEALLAGVADVAVHSAKDLPARLAPGLVVAATPVRADPRDALIGRLDGTCLATLPQAARVGTGSLRRRAQLLALRPDLDVRAIRGNVDTRLRKLEEGELDAVVLACAGLERLGLADRIHERIAPEQLLPAVAQGTLALETRGDAPLVRELVALDDAPTRAAFAAERAFLEELAGDCNVPLAAYAQLAGGRVRLRTLLAEPDGSRLLRADSEAPEAASERAGRAAAREIRAAGGDAILRRLREQAPV